MKRLTILLVLAIAIPAFAYHEFQTPQKAFKKVTIEYFSNEKAKTEADSTIIIYYDKDGLEIYRDLKKGCGNEIGLLWPGYVDSTNFTIPIGSADTLDINKYYKDLQSIIEMQTLEIDVAKRIVY